VHHKISEPRLIAAWLSGYYNAKRNNRVIDLQTLEENMSKVKNYCSDEKNFKVPVMKAAGIGKKQLGKRGAATCALMSTRPRHPDTIPKHKSGKARIEVPMREAQSSPPAHRGTWVINADALCILPISQDLSDGQERH
jgi:hypothetical protein